MKRMKQRGLSLVETLVVTAIAGAAATVVIAKSVQANRQNEAQTVADVAQQIAAMVRTAGGGAGSYANLNSNAVASLGTLPTGVTAVGTAGSYTNLTDKSGNTFTITPSTSGVTFDLSVGATKSYICTGVGIALAGGAETVAANIATPATAAASQTVKTTTNGVATDINAANLASACAAAANGLYLVSFTYR